MEESRNQPVINILKTALEWGKAPSFFLTGKDEWTEADRTLAIGYQLYQQNICDECGLPRNICRDSGRDGWVEVETETCYVKKAVDERMVDKAFDPQPGQILYPVLEDVPEGGGYGMPSWSKG